jgi:hypothetical protein
MPRKKTQQKAEVPVVDSAAADSRKWDVQVHRIIEQGATVTVLARSKDEAEEVVNTKFENRSPRFLKSIQWTDGELEQTESVVLVQEHAVGSKVKGPVVEGDDSEEEEGSDD